MTGQWGASEKKERQATDPHAVDGHSASHNTDTKKRRRRRRILSQIKKKGRGRTLPLPWWTFALNPVLAIRIMLATSLLPTTTQRRSRPVGGAGQKKSKKCSSARKTRKTRDHKHSAADQTDQITMRTTTNKPVRANRARRQEGNQTSCGGEEFLENDGRRAAQKKTRPFEHQIWIISKSLKFFRIFGIKFRNAQTLFRKERKQTEKRQGKKGKRRTCLRVFA